MERYRFTATIESSDGGGAYLLFPFDVRKEFGVAGKVPVNATFDGVPYKGSLIKYGHPQHMLPILKAIREQIGKGLGDTVVVELWKDEEKRIVDLPPAFQEAMERAGLLQLFEGLSYTNRKEYCRWISDAKKEETRAKRLAKALELLKNGVKTPDAPNAT